MYIMVKNQPSALQLQKPISFLDTQASQTMDAVCSRKRPVGHATRCGTAVSLHGSQNLNPESKTTNHSPSGETTEPDVTTTQLLTSTLFPNIALSPIKTCEPMAKAEMRALQPMCTNDPIVGGACVDVPSGVTTVAGVTVHLEPSTQW